ncbi:IS5 family transposase domain protein [Rickettsiales endosymbiont of Paramecium tredecaurelia]|uniref:transposase n=1 Tax=Candidatus Sarmatiella mevalonica TaxID=2770581 RepID=UPI0019203FB4|nr:transposase [Candidatus Sarmatiella mevalonica]MBL3284899.1 IS5 family transposase domain protein [Candidatus Sarmatiella mevalonica]
MVKAAKDAKAEVVIPSRARRKVPREYDEELYKERNLIERMFNKLKHFRRVATRYDKLDIAYLGFVFIAGIYRWIKSMSILPNALRPGKAKSGCLISVSSIHLIPL